MNKYFVPFYKLAISARSRALFWLQVQKTDGCWLWTGTRHRQGYGLLSVGGRSLKAHRASFFLSNGYMLTDMKVLHSCDNPPCVNPAHLRLGTQAENVADMKAKGRARTKPRFGEENPMAKLTWGKVRLIRALASQGMTQAAISRQIEASKMVVSRIVRNLAWKEQ